MAKTESRPTTRGWFWAGAMGVAVIVAATTYSCSRDDRWREPREYDAVVWRAEATNVTGRSGRHAMAEDVRQILLRSHPTRAGVCAKFGQPRFSQDNRAWWTLGTAPGLAVSDDCGLQVAFGADDRVATVRIVHRAE